jgi:hypothetical protein
MTSDPSMRHFPPQTLNDIVGHDAAVATIRRRCASGNHEVPLLLYGPDGVGKATVARLYAKAILCQEARDDTAVHCGYCEFCQSFDGDPGLGFAEFDACAVKKPRLAFRTKLGKASFVDHRVFVIRGIDDATPEFLDVLLKSMESDDDDITFILLAADVNGVRAAGQSRCMVQRLRPLSGADMRAFCENVFRSVGGKMASAEIADVVLAGSRGLPGVAAGACLTVKNRDLDVKAAAEMLDVGWGEDAIKYCFSLFDGRDAGNSEAFFAAGIDCGVATARIRCVLSELVHYIDQREWSHASLSGFRVLKRDLMMQLATRFSERSALVGQPVLAMWASIADLFLREDYGDPIGLGLATQTARAMLQINLHNGC